MVEIIEGTKVIARGLIKVTGSSLKLASVRSISVVGHPEITKARVEDKISYLAIQNEVVDGISNTDFLVNPDVVEYWAVTGTGYVDQENTFIIDAIVKKKCIKRTVNKKKPYYRKYKGYFCDNDLLSMYPTNITALNLNKMFEVRTLDDVLREPITTSAILSNKHEVSPARQEMFNQHLDSASSVVDWVKTSGSEQPPLLSRLTTGFKPDELVVFTATTSPTLSSLGEE